MISERRQYHSSTLIVPSDQEGLYQMSCSCGAAAVPSESMDAVFDWLHQHLEESNVG